MCTAIHLQTRHHYFGRTLDLDRSYGEQVVITPGKCPLRFRRQETVVSHFAMIGMAFVADETPLYFDAINEFGLAMAGLNFPGNAHYFEERSGCDNLTPFEFIPWILGQCRSLDEARAKLMHLNLIDLPFSPQLPLSPLHWILSDRSGSLVVESMADGLHLYDNPTGVLTNNPPFPYQMFQLNNYRAVGVDNGCNRFAEKLRLDPYCQGLGALGLPGDNSSMSRFARAVFATQHSLSASDENASVHQFFHLLGTVEMVRGTCLTDHGTQDLTIYTSCMNMDTGCYYYTTYENHQIHGIRLRGEDLDGVSLRCFPLIREHGISMQN